MTEAFLQYVWQFRLLEEPLSLSDGTPISIVSPGTPNRDAGPDFFDARIVIGDTQWVGNVEIHLKSSDWHRHHHSSDHAYDNVILHVVFEHDCDIVLANDATLPTLELKRSIPEVVWNNYEALVDPPEPIGIPCTSRLSAVSPMVVNATLDSLLVERLQKKSAIVRRLLLESRGGWDDCCYWLLAHYFGGTTNAFPFELLAKSTDLKFIARWRDNIDRLEALLFGQAGLLDDYFDDDYPRRLQADYEALRVGAGLSPISTHLWKFFRVRPSGFPTLRISQFAHLLSVGDHFFSHLIEVDDVSILESFFNRQASDYWTSHYRFDVPSSPSVKFSGKMFADSLIINAVVPLMFEYGLQHGDAAYKERAISLLRQLQPEDNNVIRLWSSAHVVARDAADSQSLLQLYNEYCKPHRCLQCRLGYYVLKDNSICHDCQ